MPLQRWPFIASALLAASCTTGRNHVNSTEAAAWRHDLAFVVNTITAGHAEPFHATSETAFRRQAARLEESIPSLSRQAIILQMGELVASIGDGHTRLPWPWDPAALDFHSLPVQFEFFSDGLFVVAASKPYSELVGGRVTKIGKMTTLDAIRAITPVVSRDNDYGVERIAKRLLAIPEVLDAVHIARMGSRVPVVIEKGGRSEVIFLPVIAASAELELVNFHQIKGTSPPLHRSSPERFYWESSLDGGRTIYVEVNAVSNQSGYSTLPQFCEKVLTDVDRGAQRIIIDLRHNAGGSRELMLPFVEGLAARETINRPDRMYVIVGRETFSAGLWAALDFSNRTRATLIGEPTAGRPNFFGETRRAETPEHHLPFTWASRFNWRTDPNDKSEALVPREIIPETFADYAAGRDPVINTILAK